MVVLDRCTDDSAVIATTWPGVKALISEHGRVGAVRDLGVRRGLAGLRSDSTWIANTDADSAVPPDWLITQIRYARAGADVLLGTVRPDRGELSPAAMREWFARHNLNDGHPHIHGANLGVRADFYRRAGGFAPIRSHEDVLLVQQARAMKGNVVSTGASPVLTSARIIGRTPTGLSSYLQRLEISNAPA